MVLTKKRQVLTFIFCIYLFTCSIPFQTVFKTFLDNFLTQLPQIFQGNFHAIFFQQSFPCTGVGQTLLQTSCRNSYKQDSCGELKALASSKHRIVQEYTIQIVTNTYKHITVISSLLGAVYMLTAKPEPMQLEKCNNIYSKEFQTLGSPNVNQGSQGQKRI